MRHRRAGLLLLILITLVATTCTGTSEAESHLRQGEEAAADGRWTDAFSSYWTALHLDPGQKAAEKGLSAAVDRLLAEKPPLPVSLEANLLQWLESQGRQSDLRSVLDRSTVPVEAGWGVMGTADGPDDERPQREVYLDAYWVDRYEITNLQYAAYLEETDRPSPAYWSEQRYPPGGALHPVVGISWREASAYCAWAGRRLPTEAEWERACRGAEGGVYPWGDDWDPGRGRWAFVEPGRLEEAWEWLARPGAGDLTPTRVWEGAEGASPFGVCGLADGASEWVSDWYRADAYAHLPPENPINEGPEWDHVVRGGAWIGIGEASLAVEASRCAHRDASHIGADPRIGFRCAGEQPAR
jgi:formylglycine-generating enzyme